MDVTCLSYPVRLSLWACYTVSPSRIYTGISVVVKHNKYITTDTCSNYVLVPGNSFRPAGGISVRARVGTDTAVSAECRQVALYCSESPSCVICDQHKQLAEVGVRVSSDVHA